MLTDFHMGVLSGTMRFMVYIMRELGVILMPPPFTMKDSPHLSSDRHVPIGQVLAICRDPTICRGKKRGEFVWCLVESPGRCPFCLPFGYGRICQIPERVAIVARTEVDRPEPPWRDLFRRGFLTIGKGSLRIGNTS